MSVSSGLVRVAVPIPLADALDYRWALPAPAPGCRVRVPLGKRERIGIVLSHPTESDVPEDRVKDVLGVLDEEPVLGPELLGTLQWSADYYHHPIGEVLNQALPVLLRRGRSAVAPLAYDWELTPDGARQDTEALKRRAPRQAQALELLRDEQRIDAQGLREAGIDRDVIVRLTDRGWVRTSLVKESPASLTTVSTDELPTLTDEQSQCVSRISDGSGYRAFLLQGVTGSGKTEVYLRLVAREIAAGRQSLLLVPEIGLTPQLVQRLSTRFGSGLAVMHSGLSAGQRLKAWQDTRTGAAKLIVGTRSAIFAPLVKPGLIIVDEEHDLSYKQQDGFKYSARDVAVFRARRLGVPIVLASATPSLESVYNARRGQYQSLTMTRRIGSAGQPTMRIVDMNRHANRKELSTPLVSAIERHLSNDRQVLLFLNRRGFAPVLLCTECGTVEECDRCDARMTLHARSGELRCHHCGRTRALQWGCPGCGSERVAVGSGTQRVSEELATLFPTARIARLDRDATATKGSLEAVLAGVHDGTTQILIGTQMLTKGHDFPGVTLVGILSADQGLFGTDFRSSERLAQIVLQVAGRAGRGEYPGEVLIQTHYPEHPLLARLCSEDYASFAELALNERAAAAWPPFTHLIVWRAEANSRDRANGFLRLVADTAANLTTEVKLLGPAPPAMERRGGRFRAQLLFHCAQRAPLHELMHRLLPLARNWPESRRVRWSVDVDPSEL